MTTETTLTQLSPRFYRIRKEIVWLEIFVLLAFAGYVFCDYWNHLNWPPHDATYPEKIKALNCPFDSRYTVTSNQVPNSPKQTLNRVLVNRRVYFEEPKCRAGLYLAFEGSGIRLTEFVYDVEKKRRTAVIVTTFDKLERE